MNTDKQGRVMYENGTLWESGEPIYGHWKEVLPLVFHYNVKTNTIVYPFTKAYRRTWYFFQGRTQQEWITEREYMILKLMDNIE